MKSIRCILICVLFTVLVFKTSFAQQYYVQGARPVYILPPADDGPEENEYEYRSRFEPSVMESEEVGSVSVESNEEDEGQEAIRSSEFHSRDGLGLSSEIKSEKESTVDDDEASEIEEYAKELAEMIKKDKLRQQQRQQKQKVKKTTAETPAKVEITPAASDSMNRNRKFPPKSKTTGLKADPATYDREDVEDDEEEDDEPEEDDPRNERPRVLWPFSISVTKSKGEPQKEPSHHHFGGLQFFNLEHRPQHHGQRRQHHQVPHRGRHHHIHKRHHHHHPPPPPPPHHGWGHGLEYEKTKLKYDIYKLKAKKKIAILQNKIELKKILSLLLHHKIKALEWLA